jgi:arylsulfatase A-like enzyme
LRGTTPVEAIDYTTDAFGRAAVTFIEKHQKDPWFVYLPFNAVHAPLQALDKYLERFKSIEDEKRRTFAAMLSALDDNVGLVLSKVRSLGLENDTLILFVSDNGGPTRNTTSGNAPLNGFKAQVWEGGIRVPFLVQWKGRMPAGRVLDQPVIQLDIHPTVLAAVGQSLPKDAKLDGVNLLPYLTADKTDAPHEALFWRFGAQRAVRKGEWKFTDLGEGPKLFNLATDLGEMKRTTRPGTRTTSSRAGSPRRERAPLPGRLQTGDRGRASMRRKQSLSVAILMTWFSIGCAQNENVARPVSVSSATAIDTSLPNDA